MTWKQLKDALDSVLDPGEKILAVHIARGKMRLEIVRYPGETLVRTPVMPKEQEK